MSSCHHDITWHHRLSITPTLASPLLVSRGVKGWHHISPASFVHENWTCSIFFNYLPLKNHLKIAIETTHRNIMSTKFAWRSKYLSWLNTHTSASKSNGQFTAWICEWWHARVVMLCGRKLARSNEVSPCFWAATTAKAVQQADSKQITEVRLPPRYIKASQLIHSDWLYLVNSIRWGS